MPPPALLNYYHNYFSSFGENARVSGPVSERKTIWELSAIMCYNLKCYKK